MGEVSKIPDQISLDDPRFEKLRRRHYAEDQISRFLYWLHPPLKKERDLLLDKLEDYRQRLKEAQELAASFAIQDQRHRVELEAVKRPEPPRILKPGTSAEVRRIWEREQFKEDS